MTKALRKNIIKCITGSLGRFFAIFMIIFIGVAFYSGLRLTKPDMVATLKDHIDRDGFYNLRLISTIGFNDDELSAIRKIDGIEKAEGSYSMDFLGTNNDLTRSVRAHLIPEDINKITLFAGRLPEKSNECVVDCYNFSEDDIGTTLTLSDKNDSDTFDFFTYDEYTITGLVQSPLYLSFEYGTTSLGNGTLDTYAYFPGDAFDSEYYTEIYVTFDKDLPLYSDEYDDNCEKMEDILDKDVTILLNNRYKDLIADAENELQDGKDTLEEKEADGKKELSDAKAELDDALKELNDAKQTLADGKNELDDAKVKLDDAAKQLSPGSTSWFAAINDAESTYSNGIKTLEETKRDATAKINDARKQLAENEALYQKSISDYKNGRAAYEEGLRKLSEGYAAYEDGLSKYNEGLKQYEEGLNAYNENVKKYKAAEYEYKKGLKEYEDGKAKYEAGLAEYESGLAEYTKAESELDAAYAQLEAAKPYISEEEYLAKKAELDSASEILKQKKAELDNAKATLDATKAQLDDAKAELEKAAAGLSIFKAELDKAKKTLDETASILKASKDTLDSSKAELDKGKAELERSKAALDQAELQLKEFRKKLDEGKAEIDANEAFLNRETANAEAQLSQLRSGIDAFRSGVISYNNGLRDYNEGLSEYEDGLSKYDDGLKEYSDGKKEFDEKIKEAKDDIADAEEKLSDAKSKDVKLYILDRMTSIAYNSFMTDSIIVEKISAVFPIFFFLVAALVCSTTMSRMVDDERTQIGTLRALGYSRRAIVSKYLIYSGSAAATGCLAGFFAGGYLFPKVIWVCYQMRYRIPGFVCLYDAKLFLVGLITSLLCSMGIAFLSCLNEMKSVPAELIRPKAPASGKRIFLEKITPLWNSFSFLIKVSLRNVFRFKKRMIMMILGIAGCTALVITGFGIKDSVANIVNFQYDDIHTYDIVVNFDDKIDNSLKESVTASNKEAIENAFITYQTSMAMKSHGFSKTANLIVSDEPDITEIIRLKDNTSGEYITFPDDGNVIMTNKLAEITNTSVGDKINLSISDTESADFTVSAIAENYVNNYIYMNTETYKKGFGSYEPKTLLISTTEGTDNFSAAADIENGFETTSIQVLEQTRNTIASIMSSLDYVVILVIASAAALAFVVLFNLGNINISERVREIATIKVLGFHRNETGGYVFRENLLLTIMGIIAGIPLGIIFHRFVISQINVEVLSFKVVIAPLSFIYSAAIVILFFCITNLILGRKLSEIDMAESLKSIE